MSHEVFVENETVFRATGEAAVFVAAIPSGYVVRPLYEDDEGNEVVGSEVVWPRPLYKNAPRARVDAELAAATEKVNAARKELWKIQEDIRAAQQDYSGLLERVRSFEGLQRIDDFLQDRITHFVIFDCGNIKIKTKDEMLKDGEYSKMRLLCLYGHFADPQQTIKARLKWMVNRWGDGSGSDTYAVPFCSEEDARAYCIATISQVLTSGPAEDSIYRPSATTLVQDALAFDLAVPESIVKEAKEERIKVVSANLARQQAALVEASAALVKLTAELRELG